MKSKTLLNLIYFLFIATFLGACNSGGELSTSSVSSSDSSDSSDSSSGGTGTAKVYINKGPITGAECNLFNAQKNKIGGPVISSNGIATFSNVNLPSSNSIVFTECTGGTYTDEATGNSKTAPKLRGAKRTDTSSSVTLINTPLTELAFRKSEDATSDLSDYFEQSNVIAESVGIGSIDINSIRPTDVNTNQAADDDAGTYGTALASISQLKKDQFDGRTLSNMLDSIENAIGTSGLSSEYKANLRESVRKLHSESHVKDNLLDGQIDNQYENLISTSQSTAYVLPTKTTISPSMPVVFNTNVTISGEGSSLDSVTASLSNGSCATVTVTENNTKFSVSCLTPSSGSTTKFTLTKDSEEVLGSAKTYTLKSISSDNNAAAQVTSVAPTTVNYAATNTFTFSGNHLPTTGATATLGSRNCTISGTPTSTSISFSCTATNDRSVPKEKLNLNIPNVNYPLGSDITYSTPPVVISSVDPASISQGQAAPNNWKVIGSGLYSGITFNFNSTNCTSNGSANDAGTEITNIDCSSINAPSSSTSANLVASGSNLPSTGNALTKAVTLSSLPVATLGWEGGNANEITERVDGRTVIRKAVVTAPSACTDATVTYSLETSPSSGVASIATDSNNQFTVTTGNKPGEARLTAKSASVAGQCQAGELKLTITVTELPIVTVTMSSTDQSITLGSQSEYLRTATSTPTSASITYSVDSSTPDGVATINATSGLATISKAGTAVIKATATADGYAAGSATYKLIVNKDNVLFTESLANHMITIGTNARNTITINPANGQSSPAITGGPQYSITSGTGTAVISSTGLIHPTKAGSITQVVKYSGDSNYNAKTENYSFIINQAPSSRVTMSWTTAPTTATYPGTQTVAALASAAGEGPAPETGNITYSSSNTSIASINASTGVITYHTAGTVEITATFNGDDNYINGAYKTTSLTINKASPTISFIGTIPSALNRGDTQQIDVRVAKVSDGSVPTGNVTVSLAPTVTGVTLTNCSNITISGAGNATGCTITVGGITTTQNIVLTATYNGDDRYISKTKTHTFSKISQLYTTDLDWYDGSTETNNFSVSAGGNKTLKLRITGTQATTPTGTVTFTTTGNSGTVTLCSSTAVNITRTGSNYGEWDCVITGGNVGTATIGATYSGDTIYAEKTAPTLTVTIN